jgi:hypothetical protein
MKVRSFYFVYIIPSVTNCGFPLEQARFGAQAEQITALADVLEVKE